MIQLRDTLVALARNKVDFVIVGGIAASLHGSAYATYDLDLCYSRSKKNLARLVDALTPLHPKLRDAPPGTPFIWDIGTVRQGFNFALTTDLGALDLFAEIPGLGGFEEVKKVSGEVKVFGHVCAVLSLPGLISAKRAAGRPKDLATLPELEALKEAGEK